MAEELKNYRCPSCGAPLVFDGETEMLHCEFCDSSFALKEMEEKTAAVTGSDWEEAGAQWGQDGEKMRSYSCPSCGAVVVCDETTVATSCPYCGNPAVLLGQFHDQRKPDLVIPFKLTKEDAVKRLQKHYQKKFLLPKVFKDQNHIEKIQGVYVPFWLFDQKAEGVMWFDASSSTTHRSGDYLITDTSHYRVKRGGSMEFQKVPVDGSSKMPDDYMDSIEPYDYEGLREFSTAYLPGFLADQYDVEVGEAKNRSNTRCYSSIEQAMRNTVRGYDKVRTGTRNITMCHKEVKYALLPVWLLSTRWNDKNYLFAMNGQTGKLVGDLPVDKQKKMKTFLGLALGLGAALSLLLSGPIGSWIAGL